MTKLKIIIFLFITLSCSSRKEQRLLNIKEDYSDVLPVGIGNSIEVKDSLKYYIFQLSLIEGDNIRLRYKNTQYDIKDLDIKYNKKISNAVSIIFADRNIKYKTLRTLFEILQTYSLNRVFLVLKNKNDDIHLRGIKLFLRHSEKLKVEEKRKEDSPPPPPPPSVLHFINRGIVKHQNKDTIFYDKAAMPFSEFEEKLKIEIKNNQEKLWGYYTQDDIPIQSFVQFYDTFQLAIFEERNRRAHKVYNKKFPHLNDSLQGIIKKQVPNRLYRMSKEEYDMWKEQPSKVLIPGI